MAQLIQTRDKSKEQSPYGTFAIRKLGGPNVNDPTRSYTVTVPHIWVTLMGDPQYVKLTRQDDNSIRIEGVKS